MKCEICERNFKSIHSLSIHLKTHNITSKDYYDLYLKTPNEGNCIVCGNDTEYRGMGLKYRQFCSCKCAQTSEQTRQKREQVNLNKYGVLNPSCLAFVKEKRKTTNILRYGVSNPYQLPHIREKAMSNSFGGKFNGCASSWEKLLEQVLIERNIPYRKEYKEKRYPYHCDFYLPNTDTFIEINGFWMHGGHFFDINNNNDLLVLSQWEEKAKTSRVYKNAIRIWTQTDLLKLQTAQKNNLQYIVLWNITDIENFILTYIPNPLNC